MAERAHENISSMAEEFCLMKKTGILSLDEINRIKEKRTMGEFGVSAKNPLFLNFINYIVFEIVTHKYIKQKKETRKHNCELVMMLLNRNIANASIKYEYILDTLEQENKKESENNRDIILQLENKLKSLQNIIMVNQSCQQNLKTKLNALEAYEEIEKCFNNRMIRLYKSCLNKFKTNVNVWCKYLNFLYTSGFLTDFQVAVADCIKANPCNEYVWCISFLYTYYVKNSVYFTRHLYLKAVQFCPRRFFVNATFFLVEESEILRAISLYNGKKKSIEEEGDEEPIESNDDTNDKEKADSCLKSFWESIQKIKSQNQNTNVMYGVKNFRDLEKHSSSSIKNVETDGISVVSLVFLMNNMCNGSVKEAGYKHVFIILCLNLYTHIQSISNIKCMMPSFDIFKNSLTKYIHEYTYEQPCIYFYLFINICCNYATETFWEKEEYQKLKKKYYEMDKNGSWIIQNEQDFVKQIKPYFDHRNIKKCVDDMLKVMSRPIFLYLVALFINNVFPHSEKVIEEKKLISDMFTFNAEGNIKKSEIKEKDNEDEGNKEQNTQDEDDEECLRILSEELARKETKFYVEDPSIYKMGQLEIFHELDKRLFLSEVVSPFKKINLNFVKSVDSATYICLNHLRVMASLCFFETDLEIKKTQYNFIHSEELILQKKKCISEILYFFLIDKKKFNNKSYKSNCDILSRAETMSKSTVPSFSCDRYSIGFSESLNKNKYSRRFFHDRVRMKRKKYFRESSTIGRISKRFSKYNVSEWTGIDSIQEKEASNKQMKEKNDPPEQQKTWHGIDTSNDRSGRNSDYDKEIGKLEQTGMDNHVYANNGNCLNKKQTNNARSTLKVSSNIDILSLHKPFQYVSEEAYKQTDVKDSKFSESISNFGHAYKNSHAQMTGVWKPSSEFPPHEETHETVSSDYKSANESLPCMNKKKKWKVRKHKFKEKEEEGEEEEEEDYKYGKTLKNLAVRKNVKKCCEEKNNNITNVRSMDSLIDLLLSYCKNLDNINLKVHILQALVNMLSAVDNHFIVNHYKKNILDQYELIKKQKADIIKESESEVQCLGEMIKTVFKN